MTKEIFMSDLLVVASKVKQYIKEKSQMNTSASTLEALTAVVKTACDQAISRAQADGRKTVMDRDFSTS
jgi:histone H3/H4